MTERKILTPNRAMRAPVINLRPVLDECPWKDKISEQQAQELAGFERFLRSK